MIKKVINVQQKLHKCPGLGHAHEFSNLQSLCITNPSPINFEPLANLV